MDNAAIMNRFHNLENDYLWQESKNKPQIGYLCMRVPMKYFQAATVISRRSAN